MVVSDSCVLTSIHLLLTAAEVSTDRASSPFVRWVQMLRKTRITYKRLSTVALYVTEQPHGLYTSAQGLSLHSKNHFYKAIRSVVCLPRRKRLLFLLWKKRPPDCTMPTISPESITSTEAANRDL